PGSSRSSPMRPTEGPLVHPTEPPGGPTLAVGPAGGLVHRKSRTKGLYTMKKSLAAGLALVALVVATVVATGATAAPSKSQAGTLTGAGATFPFPLISKWIPEVGKAYDINITYAPTGSGAGIAAITARTVDFGASDAPLSDQQLADCKGCVVIPWALAAVSVPYNLPGLNGRVNLSGP